MALATELNISDQGPLSDESKGVVPYGEMIRDYEVPENVKWRFGRPNYARVNKMYMQNRSKIHAPGSLEAVVNMLVKNWEVESHHLADPKQWKTMDISKFTCQVNGGCSCNAQALADHGPYNVLIGETPEYSSKSMTYEKSNSVFGGVFTEGYAWECLEVLSGPPTVAFKWRHFGKFTGKYTDRNGVTHQGSGEMLNLYGMCIAKVNDKLQIEALDVYYNAEDLLKPLTNGAYAKEAQQNHAESKGSCDVM